LPTPHPHVEDMATLLKFIDRDSRPGNLLLGS
jgi:hypothetical protein